MPFLPYLFEQNSDLRLDVGDVLRIKCGVPQDVPEYGRQFVPVAYFCYIFGMACSQRLVASIC